MGALFYITKIAFQYYLYIISRGRLFQVKLSLLFDASIAKLKAK